MRRGQVLHYAGWMLVDRVLPRYCTCVVIAAAIMLPLRFTIPTAQLAPDTLTRILAQLHEMFAFVFVLLLTSGLISIDRQQGYFRFYFAKPASPLWWYGQQIVLAMAGTMAASVSFVVIFAIAVTPVWSFDLLPRACAMFCLVGVPVVLLSALLRHDWLWTIVAVMVASYLRARFSAGTSLPGKIVNVLLPPYHLLSVEHRVTAWEWAWIAAWSAGLLVLILLVLARHPLAED